VPRRDAAHTHRYRTVCTWSGSTAAGYDAYDRTHSVAAPPANHALTLASDPSFLGNPELLNPEQLLLASASSCQLLAFLAVAARARIDVLAYSDDAEAVMPPEPAPMRITEIRLRPRITVAAATDEPRVHTLVAVAHRECFIANTLSCVVDVRATVVVQQPAGG
jgi:organic hydroperoxide reductase OsmC/OhrA